MDTDAKNKRQNEKAEDELIRHLLLQAEAEEYREVLAKAPPAPRHSRAYRRGCAATTQDIPVDGQRTGCPHSLSLRPHVSRKAEDIPS